MIQPKIWWKLIYSEDKKGILAGLAAHSGQISVGLSQGFSAILIPKLLESKFADQSETSWIASLGAVSNPVGALVAGFCSECFGRRSAIALATLPHATGWLLIAFAKNVPMLYVGRFISGIGTGMANALYLYVSETAAQHQRAWLANCGPILTSLGVLMVYTLGSLTTWQKSAAISIGPAILSLALTRMLRETPAWLAARGRMEEAKESLLWLRGPGLSTDTEFQELCNSNAKRMGERESLLKAFYMPNVWKPFVILLLFFALQQLSGIYIMLFYAVNVLEDIGVSVNEYAASVGIGVIRLFASIVGAILAINVGRKALAFTSGFGMALSAMSIALAFRFQLPSWVSLICMGCHVALSMIGFLTLPWVMTSELYPLRFRGLLGGITTSIAQILTFVAIKLYPEVSVNAGIENTMWIFTTAGLLGALFSIILLPETRGQSLDDIENKFTNNSKAISKINSNINGSRGLSSIFVHTQPKNIILQRFTSISEEKDSNHTGNHYTYDNFCFDIGYDNVSKESKDDENQKKDHHVTTNAIALDHVYI
ncbi:facilitated trehalose transporter Tret1 isoform X2 [Vespula maculifrons]|uniref:Facilitated trehalose transporter Tret1 isoform X2 n=1 Tax=Vespula maculifrons TaxID=7453 RepID=A0ABD2CCN3_VESMC